MKSSPSHCVARVNVTAAMRQPQERSDVVMHVSEPARSDSKHQGRESLVVDNVYIKACFRQREQNLCARVILVIEGLVQG